MNRKYFHKLYFFAWAFFVVLPMDVQASKQSSWSLSDSKVNSSSTTSLDEKSNQDQIYVAGKAGYIGGSVLGLGVGGFYKIKPHFQIGISYASGSRDLKSSSDEQVDRADFKSQIVEIGGRYFTNESFAIIGGIGQRKIDFDLKVSSKSSYIATKASGSAIVSHIGIGNFWKMSTGFTVGCEWIGMYIPISGSFDSTVTDNIGGENLENIRKLNEDLAKLMATTRSLQLLNFELGYSF